MCSAPESSKFFSQKYCVRGIKAVSRKSNMVLKTSSIWQDSIRIISLSAIDLPNRKVKYIFERLLQADSQISLIDNNERALMF